MFKALLLSFVTVFVSVQSNLSWSNPVMKEQVIQFASKQYQEITSNQEVSPQDRLYQLSMPLLALATVNDEGYDKVFQSMETILRDPDAKIANNWKLWMLGRMVLAAKLQKDTYHFHLYQHQLDCLLAKPQEEDAITGWAYAYLALSDNMKFLQYQTKLQQYAELARISYEADKTPGKASNYIWTLAMNIFAAAQTNNDYGTYLSSLRSLSSTSSLEEAIALVPEDDYRQWLRSVVRAAFQLRNDQANLKELPADSSKQITTKDTMLAWANEWSIEESTTNRLNKASGYNPGHFSNPGNQGAKEAQKQEQSKQINPVSPVAR